jgi:hypothetical protein
MVTRRDRATTGFDWRNLSGEQAVRVVLAMIAVPAGLVVLATQGVFDSPAARWLGALVLLVVVIAAIVGTTSASWTAGRRLAGNKATGPLTARGVGVRKPEDVSAVPPQASETVGALAQLTGLHQQGALTDDEFAAAKSRVLRH